GYAGSWRAGKSGRRGSAVRPPDLIRSPTSSRRWAGIVRRRLLPPRQSGERTAQSAGTVLGRSHPLTRAIDAVGRVGRQWWTCAAVVAGAVIALLEHHPWAVAVAVSAGLVLLTLTVVILALRQRVRDEAIHLIAEGRDALPIAVVQRQRQQLLSRRTKEALARTLETMLRQALRPPRPLARGARPLFSVGVIASVAPDLRAVISLLQTENASARGVALTERLIAHGNSPLYACEATVLREELRRIRSALEE
ncbi:MAG: hypothetical protein ACRDPA_23735, partial [Solirubrobacteraceae bacterium]